jgi:hypothetical protein
MNRRIPNGTYGGVGGRRLAAFSYPISVTLECADCWFYRQFRVISSFYSLADI